MNPSQSDTDRITQLCTNIVTLNTEISLGVQEGEPKTTIAAWRTQRDALDQELYETLTAINDETLFLTTVDGVCYVGEIANHHVYFHKFEALQTFGAESPEAIAP